MLRPFLLLVLYLSPILGGTVFGRVEADGLFVVEVGDFWI